MCVQQRQRHRIVGEWDALYALCEVEQSGLEDNHLPITCACVCGE